jgi:hypothetical protein
MRGDGGERGFFIKGIDADLMMRSPFFKRGAGRISNEPEQNPPKSPFREGELKTLTLGVIVKYIPTSNKLALMPIKGERNKGVL